MQSSLMPQSPTDWLPEDHLAYFVLDLIDELDLGAIERRCRQRISARERPYSPRMMTALLLYGYAVGVFSSRKIERATHEDVAFRVLAAGEHPHFTTDQRLPRPASRSARGPVSAGARGVHVSRACDTRPRGNRWDENEGEREQAQGDELRAHEQGRGRLTTEIEAMLKHAEDVDAAEDKLYGVGNSPKTSRRSFVAARAGERRFARSARR